MAHFTTSIDELWLRHDEFTFSTPANEDKPCVFAQRFGTQAAKLCQAALADPSHVTINQALLQVCKKYWEWFYAVPRNHRNRVEERGHYCIHAVFRQSYERLKVLELSLAPPMLFLPPPPAPQLPAARPQIMGVTLGEVLGEE